MLTSTDTGVGDLIDDRGGLHSDWSDVPLTDLDAGDDPRPNGRMNPRLEIQGRRITRRNGAIVRDDVKHATAADLAEARQIADELASDGFTVWIFAVEPGSGAACRFRQVAKMNPTGKTRPARTCAA